MARLEAEVQEMSRRVAQLDSRLHAWRDRWNWRVLLKRLLGVRLSLLPQYAPRPLILPGFSTPAVDLFDLPTISIVTPAFNHAQFLERTLRSVLDQDYPKLEYLVQDGGSRDGTLALLHRYRSRLHRAVSEPDDGQAHALNRGFLHASGEILAYLNSDDLLLPGALHTVAAYFRDHPRVDVVYGHRILIDSDDQEIGRWVLPPHSDQMLVWSDYVPQETLFWRRSIWEKSGAVMDQSFQFALDWDLLLRFRAAGARMVRLPHFLGAFRLHDWQKSQAQMANVGTKEMSRLRRRCHGRDVSSLEVNRALFGYLAHHVFCDRMYRLGLVHYGRKAEDTLRANSRKICGA